MQYLFFVGFVDVVIEVVAIAIEFDIFRKYVKCTTACYSSINNYVIIN